MLSASNSKSGLTLPGTVVVVIGGAGLLGQSFTYAIAAAGGTPVIADIDLARAKIAAQELNLKLGQEIVSALSIDMTSKASIQNVIATAATANNGIDAVVNCAYPKNPRYGRPFQDVEFEDFCAHLNLHLGGFFLVAQQFTAYFKHRGAGNIVNISSIYGVVAPRFEIYETSGMTMPVEYAAVKSALIHLNKYLTRYFHGSGVRFNCISPGGIYQDQPEEFVRRYNAFAHQKGLLSTDDLSGALLFLLSEHSKFITGQNIIVDDGWTS
jgi:NAD(P)-dependent dehydrogenase (short-subunit alcohol dehydrogenase family)